MKFGAKGVSRRLATLELAIHGPKRTAELEEPRRNHNPARHGTRAESRT